MSFLSMKTCNAVSFKVLFDWKKGVIAIIGLYGFASNVFKENVSDEWWLFTFNFSEKVNQFRHCNASDVFMNKAV